MTEDPWDDPATRAWSDHVRTDLVPKLQDSGAVVSIVPKSGAGDVKFWVELGASIMMDKPIVIVVTRGQAVPAKLRLVADEVVEVADWNALSAETGPLQEAIRRVLGAPTPSPYVPMTDQDKGGADFSLVYVGADGKPACRRHGAMNKVTPSPPGFWRCLQGVCRAGCEEAR